MLLVNGFNPAVKSFLKLSDVPEKLLNATKKVESAIDEFNEKWLKANVDNGDLKAARYQKNLKTLMPED